MRAPILLALALLLAFGYADLMAWAPAGFAKTWAFTDLAINSQGGFVRRGLLGDLLFMIAGTGVPFVQLAVSAGWLLVAANILLILLALRGHLMTMPTVALLLLALCPALLLFVGNDSAAFGRKDPLFLLPLLLHLEIIAWRRGEPGNGYFRGLWLLVFPALALVVYSHEAALLTLPVHWWLTGRVVENAPSRRVAHGGYVVLLLATAPAWIVSGDTATAQEVCSSLSAVGVMFPDCASPPGGIGALAWGLDVSAGLSLRVVSDPPAFAQWCALAIFSFGSVFLAALLSGLSVRWLQAVAVGAIAIALPLFALGWDWGRWISLSCFAFVLLAFHPAARVLQRDDLNNDKTAGIRLPAGRGVALLVAFSVFVYGATVLPHCCVKRKHNGFNGVTVRAVKALFGLAD